MIHGKFVVVAAGPGKAIPGFMDVKMTRRLTGWETTRLSKHFILLDFLAGRAIYRSCKPLMFDEVWKARDILKHSPHFQDVQTSWHASDSWALALALTLIVERKEYSKYRGLRPKYRSRDASEMRVC